MATNRKREHGLNMLVACTDPTTPLSGDPVRYGERPGVALTDEDANGNTSVQFDGVFNLSVKGIDAGGNAAVAAGDILYYVDGNTPKLSKVATGHRFGYAHGTVASGATATIPVKVGY